MNHDNRITDEELDIALGLVVDDAIDNEDEAQDNSIADEDEESYDFYTSTLKRLQEQDPSLQCLEICNTMDWGSLDRWRDESGFLDVAAWFRSLCELLWHAKYSPHVTHLELTNVLLDYPVLANAVTDLLDCNENCRSWKKLSIDDCMGIEPQFFKAIQHVDLSTLHLANNHVSESSLIALGNLLLTNKSIKGLRISEHFTSAAAEALSNSLVENETLVRLDLLGSTFDDFAISELAFGLEQNSGIRTLSFAYCQLRDHQLSRLVSALRQHRTLTWLDLSNNSCGMATCDALQALLSSEDDTLTTAGVGTLSGASPSLAAKAPSNLAGLSLVHTGIDDKRAIQIVSALAGSLCFKHLHLCENSITDAGIEMLASILQESRSLESLWVSENDFEGRGSQALLNLVKTNNHMLDIVLDRHLEFFEDIQHQLLLNKGGYRALKDDRISLALWPLVLERAHAAKLFCREAGPADVVYRLLQGPAMFTNPMFQKIGARIVTPSQPPCDQASSVE